MKPFDIRKVPDGDPEAPLECYAGIHYTALERIYGWMSPRPERGNRFARQRWEHEFKVFVANVLPHAGYDNESADWRATEPLGRFINQCNRAMVDLGLIEEDF